MKLNLLTAKAALVSCSGAWAEKPPESAGWKRLDFVYTNRETGEESREYFYANDESESESRWKEKAPEEDWTMLYHKSDKFMLERTLWWDEGKQLLLISEIDRYSGTMDRWNDDGKKTYDCELRGDNKF